EFVRAIRGSRAGVFVAAAAFEQPGWESAVEESDPGAPHLVFDWRPEGNVEELAPCVSALATEVTGGVESALCAHGGGPPICWCRPPLPGLPLAFAHRHGIDPARSFLIGTSATHRTLATTLGARFVAVV